MTSKITEGEVTSLVRRFFRKNEFTFLSTSANGEKLYYTVNGNKRNNKQPDSIVYKDGLVIVCEDKILFNDLVSKSAIHVNDLTKLSTFLKSEQDLDIFRFKMEQSGVVAQNIIGCLSSLNNQENRPEFVCKNLIHLGIKRLDSLQFRVNLVSEEHLLSYFEYPYVDFEL